LVQKLKRFKLFCMRVKFGVSHYIEEHTLWLYWYQCSEYSMWKNRVSKTKVETKYIGNFIYIALKQTNVNRILWKHKENPNNKLEHVAAAKCTYWRTLQHVRSAAKPRYLLLLKTRSNPADLRFVPAAHPVFHI